jgi:hypothetical protein
MDKIEMLGSPKRKGPVIQKKDYDTIADFILHYLKEKKQEMTSLHELLDQAMLTHGDIALLVLQVKRDLEARGLIETVLNNKREQFILIRKQPRKRSMFP